MLVFIPIPKKGNAKGYSNYHTVALISHASKIMLKILQARFQQYVNFQKYNNFRMYKVDFKKAEEPEVKSQHLLDHRKSEGIPKNHLLLLH